MSVTNRWDEMPDIVPLDVVREFVVTGTFDSLPDEIRRRQGFADRVSIDGSGDPLDEDRLMDLIKRVQAI